MKVTMLFAAALPALVVLHVASAQAASEVYRNLVGMAFVEIAAGEFMMGTGDLDEAAIERPDGDISAVQDEAPAHRVVLPEPFYLGETEVTQGQWLEIMGTKPGPEAQWQGPDWPHLPVVSVNWFDVERFIQALNAHDPKAVYRLPTEAEWEYAARAGTQGLRPVSLQALKAQAWYIENSGDVLHPVATRAANPWGLYDMMGNVWEWSQDWYSPDQYANTETVNPQGPKDGSKKLRRGGSYHCSLYLVRPGYRSADSPDTAYSVIGFRLIAEPGHGSQQEQ